MAVPTHIRRINRREMLAVLQRSGRATRSELARATGLSQPTAGKIADELLAEGIIEPTAVSAGAAARLGRPGHELVLSRDRSCFLAIHLGVVRTRLAGLSVSPPAADQWDRTIVTPTSAKRWINAVAAAGRALVKPSTKAIVVSVPGVLDDQTGTSLLSPNVPWLEGKCVTQMLEEAFDLPAFAVQETRCLALGHFAIDRTADSFLLVDFGPGVGSAPLLHGRLLQGQLPLTGELGHTPIAGNTRPCGCGGRGCLETVVGRGPILKSLGIESADWYPRWKQRMATLKPGELPNPFRQAIDAAALGIAGALNVLGLDRVIVTGYLSDLPDPALRVLRDGIQTRTLAGRFRTVHTAVAPRQRLAGLATVGIDRVLTPV